MGKKITALASSAAALFLMAGCSTSGEYVDARDLKEAFVDAGGSCPDWDHHDGSVLAEDSGSCGESAALSYFGEDEESYDLMIETLETIKAPALVGDNWVIQTQDFDGVKGGRHMAQLLGGKLIGESEL